MSGAPFSGKIAGAPLRRRCFAEFVPKKHFDQKDRKGGIAHEPVLPANKTARLTGARVGLSAGTILRDAIPPDAVKEPRVHF